MAISFPNPPDVGDDNPSSPEVVIADIFDGTGTDVSIDTGVPIINCVSGTLSASNTLEEIDRALTERTAEIVPLQIDYQVGQAPIIILNEGVYQLQGSWLVDGVNFCESQLRYCYGGEHITVRDDGLYVDNILLMVHRSHAINALVNGLTVVQLPTTEAILPEGADASVVPVTGGNQRMEIDQAEYSDFLAFRAYKEARRLGAKPQSRDSRVIDLGQEDEDDSNAESELPDIGG